MRKVWVVVANSSEARIFKAENARDLNEVRNLAHLESRLPNRELASDRYGQETASKAYGYISQTYDQKLTPKTREKTYFAEEIANVLNTSFSSGEFERLYLIAPPTFCAYLRERVDGNVEKLIEKEIHKDVVRLRSEEIREYLPLSL